ncbi:hypothetical protein PIROE2DRAFT_9921 [Piromyces sp. E2]|nr:hypothetical protein PIROE2DRAFT_9921 [Piromyces sp. E2]|eukprot:OUM63504.1 hypothetical protein PIROE2DRAFT_9921 [Piromyces sp. E2]
MFSISTENEINWYFSCAIANVFWTSSEIVADWYLFLRTKVIINDKNKIRPVLFTCIIYNMTKTYNMVFYFLEIPKCVEEYKKYQNSFFCMIKMGLKWYYVLVVIQIASFIYDLSIIICLRKHLFDELKRSSIFKKNSFISKFKRISEFRIFFSMIATFIFLPTLILYIILVIQFNEGKEYNATQTPLYIEGVEYFRRMTIGINITLIYIDQILLKCYVNNNSEFTGIIPSNLQYLNDSSSKTYSESSSHHNPETNSAPLSNISFYS